MTEQAPSSTRRQKGRSPSYPAINLERALSLARGLWDVEKQYPTSVDTVVKHWGYKSLNGPAGLAVAALKKYGLLTDEGAKGDRRVKITDLAVRALNHPDPAERAEAIRTAALLPASHRELWADYAADLPSDASLKWRLTQDRGFTETGADEFVPQYRSTIAFAGLGEHRADAGSFEPEDSGGHALDNAVGRGSDLGTGTRAPGPAVRTIDIPLPGGVSVKVQAPFPLSGDEWTHFVAVLTVMKPGLVTQGED